MTAKNGYVRRIPLTRWSWTAKDLFGFLVVFGCTIFWRPVMTWQFLLRNSMLRPERLGSVRMSNGLFPLWIYKGHLWVTCREANENDVIQKAAKIKPRYDAKKQWWWTFTDPSLRGLMENMDRNLLGIKQQHEKVWKGLSTRNKMRTRSTAGSIVVKDNRHIPQWVKLHVTLRDKGSCVYWGEKDLKLLEFDHRHAWSKGGSSKDPLNICLGCKTCNRSKGARDWGWG